MALTKEQIEKFGRTIEKRREELLVEIRGDVARARDESYGELAGGVVDTGDEAVADLISDLDNAETSRDLNELRDLEAAQKRLEDGSYGDCVDCGAEIDLARLRAVPGAARCVKCQSVHEKTYAHQGEPKL
ncbi:MAG TPA: TraR/DksA family transcriptional regulator [Burkholderiales bacterium]|nr:TraR/DksA family transcriptional regulator [Burkholderiales bacterium]